MDLSTIMANPMPAVVIALVVVSIVFPKVAPFITPLIAKLFAPKVVPAPAPEPKPSDHPLLDVLKRIVTDSAEPGTSAEDAWDVYLRGQVATSLVPKMMAK